jgi:hypothetical protein
MNEIKYKDNHPVFYIIYIIGNILSFGSLWICANLIGFGIAKAMDIKESPKQ